MDCNELVEVITDYLEGHLSDSERSSLEEHLGECEGCHEYLEQMRVTVRGLGKLEGNAIPPEAKEKLLAVFRDWKKGGP